MYHHHDLENNIQNPLASASRFLKARAKGNLEVKPVTVTNLSTFQPFNHSTNYPSPLTLHPSRKCAFTLAEVLITIGIIGVVAALTMPMLISKYNEMVTVTQLKKTYAELQQAIKLSEVENGSLKEWEYPSNYTGSKDFAEKYITPYLSQNYNKISNKSFDGEYAWKKPNGTLGGQGYYYLLPHNRYNDKIILFNPANTELSTALEGRAKYVQIIVDINGLKGKSIMGKDVFMFTLYNYTYTPQSTWTSICPKGELYGLYQGSGLYMGARCGTLEDMLGTGPRGGCNMSGDGTSCGLAIEKNGWKIPKDYPIKF